MDDKESITLKVFKDQFGLFHLDKPIIEESIREEFGEIEEFEMSGTKSSILKEIEAHNERLNEYEFGKNR